MILFVDSGLRTLSNYSQGPRLTGENMVETFHDIFVYNFVESLTGLKERLKHHSEVLRQYREEENNGPQVNARDSV